MQLFVSTTSPYARLVMITALRANLNNVRLIFVNPWENPDQLTTLNPFSQVPALLTDNGHLITETPIIINHLAPPVFNDEHRTALIAYSISMINQAVRAFGTQRFQPENSPPHPFITRATECLTLALATSPLLQTDSDDLGQIFWGVSLVYLQLRLPEVYENFVVKETQQAVEIFKQRDIMQQTATPQLEKLSVLATQKTVTINDLKG